MEATRLLKLKPLNRSQFKFILTGATELAPVVQHFQQIDSVVQRLEFKTELLYIQQSKAKVVVL